MIKKQVESVELLRNDSFMSQSIYWLSLVNGTSCTKATSLLCPNRFIDFHSWMGLPVLKLLTSLLCSNKKNCNHHGSNCSHYACGVLNERGREREKRERERKTGRVATWWKNERQGPTSVLVCSRQSWSSTLVLVVVEGLEDSSDSKPRILNNKRSWPVQYIHVSKNIFFFFQNMWPKTFTNTAVKTILFCENYHFWKYRAQVKKNACDKKDWKFPFFKTRVYCNCVVYVNWAFWGVKPWQSI